MVKIGSLFICDRCGKEHFFENGWETTYVDDVSGWSEELGGKQLCPDCSKELNKILDKFFGVIKEEAG